MEFWLWAVIGILVLIIIVLSVKLYLMRKSAREIEMGLAERLVTETNTLIDLSCRDHHMRSLAAAINTQLRELRRERRRFQQGDLELKEAVTNLSHDLRTPLTAICGYLDLLEREEVSDTARRYLSLIDNRAEVMKQLTEELFSYSIITSTEEGPYERLSLNSVLEESLASHYGALTARGIVPEVVMPEQAVERCLNRSALRRVFGNLISNALKYSDGDLAVTLKLDGTISFSNTAKNLNPVMVGRLFDRFYTVETGRNATGLGLSIARHLTEQMGGTITAEYRDGKLYLLLKFP